MNPQLFLDMYKQSVMKQQILATKANLNEQQYNTNFKHKPTNLTN